MANIFKLMGSVIINDAQAQQSMRDLETSAKNIQEKFKDVGEKIGKFGAVTAGAVGGAGTLLYQLGLQGQDAGIKLQAGLGISAEEAKKFQGVAKGLYENGFGESMDDVINSIITVKQNLKDVNDADLGKITSSIMNVSSITGEEAGGISKAVDSLMQNFGITATQALDMITKGQQDGLNKSQDMLDTFNEYAPQFKSMGLTADQFFNILKGGADGGTMNLDKVADAFKEFNIRAQDGSKTTAEGFKMIGLNGQKMGEAIAGGGAKGADALNQTLIALGKIKDPIKQNQAGVDLFGTQWEDLRGKVITSMADSVGAVNNLDGSTSKLNDTMNKSTASTFAGTMRQLKDALDPLAQAVLKFVQDNLPAIQQFAQKTADFFNNMSPAMQKAIVKFGAIAVAVGTFLTAIAPVIGVIGSVISWVIKLVKWVGTISTIVEEAGGAFALLSNPIGWVILAIGAVIAIIVVLWHKSEAFRDACKSVWGAVWSIIQKVTGDIMSILGGFARIIGSVLVGVWDVLTGNWRGAWESLKSIVKGAIDVIKGIVGGVSDVISGVIGGIQDAISWASKLLGISGGKKSDKKDDKKKNANGTDNFSGGWTMVGEQGMELVKLPQGSKIYPNHDLKQALSDSGAGSSGVTQNITINSPKPLNAGAIARATKKASQQLALNN